MPLPFKLPEKYILTMERNVVECEPASPTARLFLSGATGGTARLHSEPGCSGRSWLRRQLHPPTPTPITHSPSTLRSGDGPSILCTTFQIKHFSWIFFFKYPQSCFLHHVWLKKTTEISSVFPTQMKMSGFLCGLIS